MTMRLSGFGRLAMGLAIGLVVIPSCGGDQPEEAGVGELGVPLQDTTPSGVVYRLRSAVFDVVGPDVTTLASEDFAPDVTGIFTQVRNGRYDVSLRDGWFMEHSADGLPFSPIDAELLTTNPVSADVVADQQTLVRFEFEVNADTIVFGQGTLVVLFEVDELVPLTVFVSNARGLANFGGVANADATCQSEARSANLTGTYRAWLSTPTYSPLADWGLAFGNHEFVRPDGAIVATSWADLTDGQLTNPIVMNADGSLVPTTTPDFSAVWTGTLSTGAAAPGSSCDSWTNADPAQETTIGQAASSADWTDWGTSPCGSATQTVLYRWYCFEQPAP